MSSLNFVTPQVATAASSAARGPLSERPVHNKASLYAFTPEPSAPLHNPFAGTRITAAGGAGAAPGIEVVADNPAAVAVLHDAASDCCVYKWGLVAHPRFKGEAMLRWCLDVAARGAFGEFSQLVGPFVLIVDDRRKGRVYFVSDPLGVRPWFVGHQDGRLVGGGDAWGVHDAGFAAGPVNYEAVACWLKYGYDCSGGSLFTDLSRQKPGGVATWDVAAKQLSEAPYVRWPGGDANPPREQVVGAIHDCMTRAFDALTDGTDLPGLTSQFSGGYDSRYLAALAARKLGSGRAVDVKAYCVPDDPTEAQAAGLAAKALDMPLEIIPVESSPLDVFDDPYHYTPEGFPITKHVSHLTAERRPGVPVLNGYLGGQLIKGDNDRACGKLETETGGEELAAVAQRQHHLKKNRLDVLGDSVREGVESRSLEPMRRRIEEGRAVGKPFFFADLMTRQRHYIANNFTEHLHLAEAVLPFYSHDLVALKLGHANEAFGWETYEQIFRTFFPELVGIPHNKKIKADPAAGAAPRPSRHVRRWALGLLASAALPGTLAGVTKRKVVHRLLSAAAGKSEQENLVLLLRRMLLLERRLRKAGVEFDWRKL